MRNGAILLVTGVVVGGCGSVDAVGPDLAIEGSCMWVEATRAYTEPWAELTDEQLNVEISRACGRVLIGFKEAERARGVDETGLSLTSAETVLRMKQLLRQLDVTIEHEYDLPAVSARLHPRGDLIVTLRHHPHVDYLEPVFPGTRW
jgi:hypothetical protein